MLNFATPSPFGRKSRRFPTSPNLPLNQYPDVTENFQDVKFHVYNDIARIGQLSGRDGVLNALHSRFQPKGLWDTRFHQDLPGFDSQGHPQWARYKNVIVPGSYLKHSLFGHALGASGYGLKETPSLIERPDPKDTWWGERRQLPGYGGTPPITPKVPYSSEGITGRRKIPSLFDFYHPDGEWLPRQMLPQKPPNRWSLRSGYFDYTHHDPWREGTYSDAFTLNASPAPAPSPSPPSPPVTIYGHVWKQGPERPPEDPIYTPDDDDDEPTPAPRAPRTEGWGQVLTGLLQAGANVLAQRQQAQQEAKAREAQAKAQQAQAQAMARQQQQWVQQQAARVNPDRFRLGQVPLPKQPSWFPAQSLPPAAPASPTVGLGGPPRGNILPQQGNLGQNIAYGNPSGGNLYPNPVRDMAQGDSGYIPAVNGQVQGGAQHPPARMGQALPPTPYGYNTPTASPWSATPDQIARRNMPWVPEVFPVSQAIEYLLNPLARLTENLRKANLLSKNVS